MKKYYLIYLIVLLLMVPVVLPASVNWDKLQVPVMNLLGVVLTAFGVPLILKLSKKWGLTIEEQIAKDAIDALINILVNIDMDNKNADGMKKKRIAVITAKNHLPVKMQEILIKKYGSLEAAVQIAYENSSLNTGGVK